jgi:hypothetical protein
VLFWFIGCSCAIVWNVFRDPGIDYRVLALGSLTPDVIDLATGHRVAHALTTAVVALVVLMMATIGRKALRRRLLMLPIGMLLHLVLDGVFSSTRTFWWPASGLRPVVGHLPSLDRPIVLNAAFELVGLLILRWFWRRFELKQADRRAEFLSTGYLPIS